MKILSLNRSEYKFWTKAAKLCIKVDFQLKLDIENK